LIRGNHGFKRSLPKEDALQDIPDIAQFLRDVLVFGRSEDNVDTNSMLEACYHKGWLQAELVPGGRTVYIFPTKIHQWYKFSFVHNHHYSKLTLSLRYAEHLLRITAQPFPKDRFGTITSRPRFGGDSQAFSWYRPAGKVQLVRNQLYRTR
jgi:hypothetical protein